LLVGSTVIFGDGILKSAFAHRQEGILAFVAVFVVVILLYRALRAVLSFQGRRRLIGFLKRKLRWEFWPAWAAYLPLIPYLVYLAIRYRSLTLFTVANPGIPTGGFVGESKSEILRNLGDAVAAYRVIREPYPAGLDLDYPVVLKPDVGERGSGVAVVRSRREFEDYLARAHGDIIIQRYVPGVEFGVFYYRYPGEARGRIFSITEKRFPEVVGDGRSTVGDLILRDPRAVCLAGVYRVPSDTVPAAGERVRLVELGSHCRGAIFLDGIRWNTPMLADAVERISQAHTGFYFGRFDLRAASVEAFQQGDFRVIELNGVAAEATHIYDPAVSLLDAYRTMFTQWRIAFEIGAINRARGFAPMPLLDLLRVIGVRVGLGATHFTDPSTAALQGGV
jgi:hypothetical protein